MKPTESSLFFTLTFIVVPNSTARIQEPRYQTFLEPQYSLRSRNHCKGRQSEKGEMDQTFPPNYLIEKKHETPNNLRNTLANLGIRSLKKPTHQRGKTPQLTPQTTHYDAINSKMRHTAISITVCQLQNYSMAKDAISIS